MDFVERSKEIFALEITELQKLANRLGPEINEAVEMIYNCKGN